MIRVALKLALSAAAVWAVFTFVPVRGRTGAERWAAAGSLSAFIDRSVAEAAAALRPPSPSRPSRPQARAPAPASRERPTEGHTEADRRALDRILAEQLAERPR